MKFFKKRSNADRAAELRSLRETRLKKEGTAKLESKLSRERERISTANKKLRKAKYAKVSKAIKTAKKLSKGASKMSSKGKKPAFRGFDYLDEKPKRKKKNDIFPFP